MDKVIPSKGQYLATGHYANVQWREDGRPMLYRARDLKKDQSFFLSSVTEESLKKVCTEHSHLKIFSYISYISQTIFPLGHLLKNEVRELALKHKLPTAQREESMGLCFVGEKRRFNDFLCMFPILTERQLSFSRPSAQYLRSTPGQIVDLAGNVLASHNGLWQYTLGQGAKICGQPEKMFVASKISATNQIVVVPGT